VSCSLSPSQSAQYWLLCRLSDTSGSASRWEAVSPQLRWLCRTCKTVRHTEAEIIEHIAETGHTEISLRRSR